MTDFLKLGLLSHFALATATKSAFISSDAGHTARLGRLDSSDQHSRCSNLSTLCDAKGLRQATCVRSIGQGLSDQPTPDINNLRITNHEPLLPTQFQQTALPLPTLDLTLALPQSTRNLESAAAHQQPIQSQGDLRQGDLHNLAVSLGGKAITLLPSNTHAVQYQKSFIHPKTGEPISRHFTIYPPQALPDNELRNLKATLKVGNPRTYGTPALHYDPTKDAVPSAALSKILKQNYVLTIRDAHDSKFGAIAVVHPNKCEDADTAYIGQVVNGPRDPHAGDNTPLRGSEQALVLKGGGSLAVAEALQMAAHLGFDRAKLYTDRPSLGARMEDEHGNSLGKTFYDKCGENLGLGVEYQVITQPPTTPITQLAQSDAQQPGGIMGQNAKLEFHYTYTGLAQLRQPLN